MKKIYICPDFKMKVVDHTNIIATSFNAKSSDNDSRIMGISICDDENEEVKSEDDVL